MSHELGFESDILVPEWPTDIIGIYRTSILNQNIQKSSIYSGISLQVSSAGHLISMSSVFLGQQISHWGRSAQPQVLALVTDKEITTVPMVSEVVYNIFVDI